jgi:hypothetical protein
LQQNLRPQLVQEHRFVPRDDRVIARTILLLLRFWAHQVISAREIPPTAWAIDPGKFG